MLNSKQISLFTIHTPQFLAKSIKFLQTKKRCLVEVSHLTAILWFSIGSKKPLSTSISYHWLICLNSTNKHQKVSKLNLRSSKMNGPRKSSKELSQKIQHSSSIWNSLNSMPSKIVNYSKKLTNSIAKNSTEARTSMSHLLMWLNSTWPLNP